MPNILVPVDGSPNSLRAVTHAIEALGSIPGLELHVVNIQPPIVSGAVRSFVDKKVIDEYYEAEGKKALEQALAVLADTQVAHTSRIEVGPVAETIAQYVADHQIEQVVMGTRGLGALSGFWLGSVTTKTLHLVNVPVTLIK